MPSVARLSTLKGRDLREDLALTHKVETRELPDRLHPFSIVRAHFVSSTHLHTFPHKKVIIDLTSRARSEQMSSSWRLSMSSLDTASPRSSSIPQSPRLTRTPRHLLISCSLMCSLSRTCSGSRSARPEHGARLVRAPLAPCTAARAPAAARLRANSKT